MLRWEVWPFALKGRPLQVGAPGFRRPESGLPDGPLFAGGGEKRA
jgi:hypothetical protein